MKTGEVVEILNHIREKIPTISRVTSYARATPSAGRARRN
jgi:hypothetical protein